jgi:hypothetical protein
MDEWYAIGSLVLVGMAVLGFLKLLEQFVEEE